MHTGRARFVGRGLHFMGTYIKFRVDEARRKKAGAWLRKQSNKQLGLWDEQDRKAERAKGDRGNPDHLPLGVGQHKLSGGGEDNSSDSLIEKLILARIKFGLECFDIPSNVGDYIRKPLLKQLIDLPLWEAKWRTNACARTPSA